MNFETIDYHELPGQNPLFLSYLDGDERSEEFYLPIPRSEDEFRQRVSRVLESEHFDRELLVEELVKLNSGYGGGTEVLRNLEILADPSAVAVVTGQQVGLMGGPGYSASKAITAISKSRNLQKMGISAIPVFWLAADDSDFDEVRSTNVIDANGEVLPVAVDDPRKRLQQMVGTVRLQEVISEFDQFSKKVDQLGTWSGQFQKLVESYHRPEETFRGAFGCWLNNLFRRFGLIIFDPLMPVYRRHLTEFYIRAIEKRQELLDAVTERTAKLKAKGFPVQVHIDSSETFLFLVERDCRYKLEYQGGMYRLKDRPSRRFTAEALCDQISSGEAILSPNVLLRPVLQDYLFPTILAVTGPAEIAYFSQVNALSRFWKKELIAFPRAGFTLVDRKVQRLLKKYSVQVRDIVKLDSYELTEKLLRQGEPSSVLSSFDDLKSDLDERLNHLRIDLKKLDPTVAAMLSNAERKMLYQVGKVRRRFVENQREQQSILRRHLNHLISHLVPRGSLQERVLNFNYLLSIAGPGTLDRLIEQAQTKDGGHWIVYL